MLIITLKDVMISYNGIINICLFQYSTKKCLSLICVPHIYLIYSYIQRRFRGFIAITFVCPFVCEIVSSPVFYYVENWKFLHYKKIAYDPRVCHNFDQAQLGKFKVTGRKCAKFVSDLYLFYGEKLDFFFTPRLFRPEGVSSFRPLSYGLVQCHWKETCISVSGPYLFMENNANIIFHSKKKCL